MINSPIRIAALFLLAVASCAHAASNSPRIGALQKAVHRGEAGAAAAFWAEIANAGGTPLIECPAQMAPDCLTTFLWRGESTTKNVVIRSEAMPGLPEKHLFRHLPDTDVWYRTYRFRNDARFMYMLSINDPLTSWDIKGPERAKRYAGVRTDPLNRYVTSNPRSGCYVSLPKAPSEYWSTEHAGVAHGRIRDHELSSAVLSGARRLRVYTTPGTRVENGATTVLVMFDGDESVDLLHVPLMLDNLRAEGRISPMIAVFLSQPYETRESDLGCSEATAHFVAEELLPWLRKEYRIRTAPERTIASGASLGGLQAACTALQHPASVGRVLAQSAAFWWGKSDSEPQWMAASLKSKPAVNVKFYLDVGLMETKDGPLSQLATNRRVQKILVKKGYKTIYREWNGTHSYPCWRATFADALTALLSD